LTKHKVKADSNSEEHDYSKERSVEDPCNRQNKEMKCGSPNEREYDSCPGEDLHDEPSNERDPRNKSKDWGKEQVVANNTQKPREPSEDEGCRIV
jgi:hypothetical protein